VENDFHVLRAPDNCSGCCLVLFALGDVRPREIILPRFPFVVEHKLHVLELGLIICNFYVIVLLFLFNLKHNCND
jgi:hypothetical protein